MIASSSERVRPGAGGDSVGVRLERKLAELLPLQYEDGGWGSSWITSSA